MSQDFREKSEKQHEATSNQNYPIICRIKSLCFVWEKLLLLFTVFNIVNPLISSYTFSDSFYFYEIFRNFSFF